MEAPHDLYVDKDFKTNLDDLKKQEEKHKKRKKKLILEYPIDFKQDEADKMYDEFLDIRGY